MADTTCSRAALHQLLDSLPDDQMPAARAALTQVQQDALRSTLASIPGLHLPAHWPPRYSQFKPLSVEGNRSPSN